MKINAQVKIRYEKLDAASGSVLKASPWKRNLIYDPALTGLAIGSVGGLAGLFQYCKVGATAVNSVGGGFFSQSTTTITACNSLGVPVPGWFTTNGITGGSNWLIKYGTGTGGTENYILSIDGTGTYATVASSATVAATAGTAWFVNQTTLSAPTAISTSYGTTGNTSYASNVATLTQVFNFAAANYSFGWIGYSSNNNNDGTVNGSVLQSDSLTNTQFLRVTIQIQYTLSPGAQTAVSNVFTGTLSSAGTAMVQLWDGKIIPNGGGLAQYQNSFAGGTLDGSLNNICAGFFAAALTLQTTIQAVQFSSLGGFGGLYTSAAFGSFSNSGLTVGVANGTVSFSFNTSGETISAIAFGGWNFVTGSGKTSACAPVLAINLTTPWTLPIGVFAGSLTLQRVFTRTLSN
jgi:hypothetical protein